MLIQRATGIAIRSTSSFNNIPIALNTVRASVSAPRPFYPLQSFKLGSSLSTTSAADMADVKQFVDQKIAGNSVVVFGKSYCPYCHKAKSIISNATDEFEYLDIDLRDDGSAIQAYLKQLNGQGTVPHVYIKQEFIGGCSDLQALPEKKLKAKIAGSA